MQRTLLDDTQHSQETNIHGPAGFEPTIPAGERPQTHALDSAATINMYIVDLNFRSRIFKNKMYINHSFIYNPTVTFPALLKLVGC